MDKKAIREALENGWSDKIFLYYQQYVNVNAARPQNEFSQEWQDILGTLAGISKEEPKKEKKDDKAGSLRDKESDGSVH